MLTQTTGKSAKSPCYKCEAREPGCHAKCEAYAEWKAKDQLRLETEKRNRHETLHDPRKEIRAAWVDNNIRKRAKK